MQINNLEPSQITGSKPAVAVATPDSPKPVAKPAPKSSDPKVPEAKKADAPPIKPEVNGTTKAEITDVKPTGESNAEGEPTFTLKVNGQEYKATQSEIIALAQKARGAEQAMKQKAEIEKLASDLLSNFDNDTFGLLVKRHGKEKAAKIAVDMVRNLIAEEEKDPRDRENEELRAKNKEYEEAKERVEKERMEAERRVQQQELYRTMLVEIDKELNETNLPKDKLTLTRVLNYLAAGKKANGQAWTIKDSVQAVEQEDMSHASHYAKRYVDGKLPSDKFRAIFGEEAVKKLNKEQINVLKNADKIAKHEQPKADPNGVSETPKPRRSLSKTRGTDGMSEREYRKVHGSLGGI